MEEISAKDLSEYKTTIAEAEPLVVNSTEADKIYLSFYKSMVPLLELNTAENQNNPQAAMQHINSPNINNLAVALNNVLEYEKQTGKKVYTDDILETISSFKPMLLNYAVFLGNQSKNKEAADLLYAIYQLEPTDVDNLYYAASYATNAKDYDNALGYYDQLKALNYSGDGMIYYATSLASDKEEPFATKAERDQMIRLKTHKNARDEKQPSKRGEIYKNTALILVQQNKIDEAKAAIAAARKENPDDTSLMMTEADLYLQLEDYDSYKKIVGEVLQQNPNDADLTFNLGVISMQAEQNKEAEAYFKKAIEIDPTYLNAYINLAGLILRGDQKLVDEMNNLGTTAADNKRYDQLKKQRVEMFTKALPYLEKAHALDASNELVIDNLLSVYGVLEHTDKYKALKAKRQ